MQDLHEVGRVPDKDYERRLKLTRDCETLRQDIYNAFSGVAVPLLTFITKMLNRVYGTDRT